MFNDQTQYANKNLPKSLHKKKSSCCSHGNEKNCTVRFNEGLLTGSTEMLNATKFYQNCANEDTESHWMEIYNEQKIIEQISSERTHSAESKIDGNFNGYLQRCHEMENIDKVAYKG
uniref:Bm629 n=1 Tax=Brugia malayi TaxID=6279 RepID=A0A0H5S9R8_BRUMA|nr:Bm629 [Brugia malayi]